MKTKPFPTFLLLLLVASGPLWIWLLEKNQPEYTDLRIMSFNIRQGNAKDEENNWVFRKQLVADVIRDANLDIVALQEVYRFQLDELLERLPEFDAVSTGRDGEDRGEHCPILFRKDRFTATESETFWLSDTPEVPSASWGNNYRRICTWVRLTDRHSGKSFTIYNSHFDHESQLARENGARLIMQKIASRSPDDRFFFCGDFNAGEDNPIITYLKGTEPLGETNPIPLLDTWRIAHPQSPDCGTICRFIGSREPVKIDYILTTPGIEVMSSYIVRTNREGRYPSDHYPVVAWVRVK